MNDFVTITCQCGHTAPLDRFTHTLAGELPPGDYQCPGCSRAWRIIRTPITSYQGRIYSQPNKIQTIQASL